MFQSKSFVDLISSQDIVRKNGNLPLKEVPLIWPFPTV